MEGLDLLSSLIKLVAVFVLLALTLHALARYQRRQPAGRAAARRAPSALVEVVDQTRLGRSASLVAVRAGSRTLLLGLTEQRVELLSDLSADIEGTAGDHDDADPEPPSPQERQGVLDRALEILEERMRE